MKNETWLSFSSVYALVHWGWILFGYFQNIVVPNTEEGRIDTVIELQQPNTVLGLSQSTFIILTCESSTVFLFLWTMKLINDFERIIVKKKYPN